MNSYVTCSTVSICANASLYPIKQTELSKCKSDLLWKYLIIFQMENGISFITAKHENDPFTLLLARGKYTCGRSCPLGKAGGWPEAGILPPLYLPRDLEQVVSYLWASLTKKKCSAHHFREFCPLKSTDLGCSTSTRGCPTRSSKHNSKISCRISKGTAAV